MLSHYTSERGLHGISRQKALRATEFLSLNDETEFSYAMSEILTEALTTVWGTLPEDVRVPVEKLENIPFSVSQWKDFFRDHMQRSDGYGALYVTSFSREAEGSENSLLWERYTGNSGYCLRFSEDRIRRLVHSEAQTYSYHLIELVDVIYGVDSESPEFRKLVEQVALVMLKELSLHLKDARLAPDVDKMKVASVLEYELLKYCASHKAMAHAVEQETRVLAYPCNATQLRSFTGFASPKTVCRHGRNNDGARYIVLGDTILPGVVPEKIIIGPTAKLEHWMMGALYPAQPSTVKSRIQIQK